MQLVRFLTYLFKKGGFILIDANDKEYIIGNPDKGKPLKLKLLDKKLHYKLLLYPDLYFGESYADGKLTAKEKKKIMKEVLDVLKSVINLKWKIF